MTEPTGIVPVDLSTAAAALRAAGAEARGFLGVDPVTQNDALLVAELTRIGAIVADAGTGVVGYAPNEQQPRQGMLAGTSDDPEPVRAMMAFLLAYRRCSSFVAMPPSGSAACAAFEAAGFTSAGVLREHRFQSGRYVDVQVYFARMELPCPS